MDRSRKIFGAKSAQEVGGVEGAVAVSGSAKSQSIFPSVVGDPARPAQHALELLDWYEVVIARGNSQLL